MASDPKRLKMNEEASSSTFKEETIKADIDTSTSNFAKIVRSNCYVDKTPLIKTIFCNSASGIVITAPRRFGKSTNMDMVKKFVEIQRDVNGAVIDKNASSNYRIFKDLLIFQDKDFFDEHFANYPVIYVTFKCVDAYSFEVVLASFRTVLHYAFEWHSYLLQSDKLNSEEKGRFRRYWSSFSHEKLTKTDIESGLPFLSKCLYKHFGGKKVFVLIDEYDAPINNAMFHENIDISQLTELLCKILSNILQGNEYVERALITGISHFASAGLSRLNNIENYMFLGNHPFVEYYGLIESELDTLLSTFKIVDNKEIEKIKSYYNAYYSRGNVKIFSLWSVLHYLKEKKFRLYWQNSGTIDGLRGALRFPRIQIAIEKLLKNESKNIEIFDDVKLDDLVKLQNILLGRADETIANPDLFLNFLLQQGYLTYKGTENQENSVKMQNNEKILDEFREDLNYHYKQSTNSLIPCSAAFDQISVSDIESFQEFVETFQRVVHRVSLYIIKENEHLLNSLLICVICRAHQFQVYDDPEFFETRLRPDLIGVKDNKNAFMFAIKFRLDCEKALQQIIENKYYTKFDGEEFKDLQHKVYLAVTVSEDLSVRLGVLVNTLDINKAKYFVPRYSR